LILSIPLIILITIINFSIVHLAPGGPQALLVNPRTPPQVQQQVIRAYGLDKPLWEQLLSYVVQTLQGNLGYSYFYHTSVLSLIESRIPATLFLMGTSLLFSVFISIPMGVISARRKGSKIDGAIIAISVFGYSMPAYVLGLILLTIFSLYLGWFPSSGIATTTVDWLDISSLAKHVTLPAATLVIGSVANYSLFIRGSLVDVLRQDFIMVARGKGLTESRILYRHALPNALLPAVTNIGLSVAFLLGGAVLTETVFSWPGLGLLTYNSIVERDYPVVLGLFFIFSLVVILVNLGTDIVYSILDPRIAYD
jgi:peptide/nickel transport system permease protein